MEQQEKQFDAVLKKSVAMYSMLTGKPMTEREGRAFIEIFDMTEAYLANGATATGPVETFDILSHIEPDTMPDIPAFVGRTLPDDATPVPRKNPVEDLLQSCGCPVGRCTCTDQMLDAAKKLDIPPQVLKAVAHHESSENKTPIGGIVETENGRFKDGKREAEIDAAWQSREIEQAEEADRIESDRRKAESRNSFDTDDRDDHRKGFDYQIVSLCRLGVRSNSTIRCFAAEPSPEVFWELYRNYDNRTHWCFINQWQQQKGWVSILTDYMDRHAVALRNLRGTLPSKGVKVTKGDAPRALNMIAIAATGWEKPEFAWCINRKDGFKQYQESEPTRVELVKASTTKYIATKQKRPEIYLGH